MKKNSRAKIFPTENIQIKHIPLKRIFDILFSMTALTFLSPLLLLITLLIKFSCGGKSIYAQERIGRGGKRFKCYKFRTMFPDAEKRLQEILHASPELKNEWKQSFKLKNDPRITPLGRFLRRTSLDELPQFWNVLKGDLSVVGPRPVVLDEIVDYYKEKAEKVLSIRPGITGLWQISGRSDLQNYETRVSLDEHYVDHRAFFSDLKIVLKTIPCIFLSRGAY